MLLQVGPAKAIMDRVLAEGETLHAPHILDLEVSQVVRRYWQSGNLTPERGREALHDLGDLPINRYSHEPLIDRVWELRHNSTAYDAAYLALAEALRAPLVTSDSVLAAVPGIRAKVEVFR